MRGPLFPLPRNRRLGARPKCWAPISTELMIQASVHFSVVAMALPPRTSLGLVGGF